MIEHKWAPISKDTIHSIHVNFDELDSLQDQWLSLRKQAEASHPRAYQSFTDQLIRSLAIETGILEGLYELDTGVTKTLIEKGLVAENVERWATNKEPHELIRILKDHEASVEHVYEWIRLGRPLTKWFIQSLHQVITRNQPTYRAVNQFREVFEARLLPGEFKKLPNNPTRPEGEIHEYCPPEQVDSEVDNLIAWYAELEETKWHPLAIASWFHHCFTQIHPFQDGNGRVARALLTWHLVKDYYLPVVVTRDKRSDYIEVLEEADRGDLSPLADFLAASEKATITQALSVQVAGVEAPRKVPVVDQVIDSIVVRAARQRLAALEQMRSVKEVARNLRGKARDFLYDKAEKLTNQLESRAQLRLTFYATPGGPDFGDEYYYKSQVIETAKSAGHVPNLSEPRFFVKLSINPGGESRNPRLVFVVSLHHVGRELTGVMACTAFAILEYYDRPEQEQYGSGSDEVFKDCTPNAFTFTWRDQSQKLETRFADWLELSLALALKYWGESLTLA